MAVPEGEAETPVKEIFTYGAAHHPAGVGFLEHGLEMHGLPHGAGLYIFSLHGQAHGFSVRPKQFRGDEDHGVLCRCIRQTLFQRR